MAIDDEASEIDQLSDDALIKIHKLANDVSIFIIVFNTYISPKKMW